jgi:hypothetical protein
MTPEAIRDQKVLLCLAPGQPLHATDGRPAFLNVLRLVIPPREGQS